MISRLSEMKELEKKLNLLSTKAEAFQVKDRVKREESQKQNRVEQKKKIRPAKKNISENGGKYPNSKE